MLKRSQIFLLLSLFLFLIIYLFLYLDLNKNLRIAHAGGKYNGKNYPNSIASIKYNLKFTKYFELDFQLTKDRRLVCLHGPKVNLKLFDEIKNEILRNDYCYDKILKEFLDKNKDIKIITDFKTDNIKGLNFIKEYFGSSFDQFIPQIYYENEYQKVKDLGFKKIIFTFYRIPDFSNDQIKEILDKKNLFAVTMDPSRIRKGIMKKLDKNKYFVYVHTVNSRLRFLQYKLFFGADEIYTNTLF